jgi:hypothetical protein
MGTNNALATSLAFPLGFISGVIPVPSGTITGPPLGALGSAYGPYFNPQYPAGLPGATYPNFYSLYPQGSLSFLRWMSTPLVDGSTVVDLVMPDGYDQSDSWYIAVYTYFVSLGAMASDGLYTLNGPTASNTANQTIAVPGEMGVIILGTSLPPGGGLYSYDAPWFRFFSSASTLNTGDNVIDLVMLGGPSHPAGWYIVIYTYGAGIIT